MPLRNCSDCGAEYMRTARQLRCEGCIGRCAICKRPAPGRRCGCCWAKGLPVPPPVGQSLTPMQSEAQFRRRSAPQICIRVTAAERRWIGTAAAAHGMSMTEFIVWATRRAVNARKMELHRVNAALARSVGL